MTFARKHEVDKISFCCIQEGTAKFADSGTVRTPKRLLGWPGAMKHRRSPLLDPVSLTPNNSAINIVIVMAKRIRGALDLMIPFLPLVTSHNTIIWITDGPSFEDLVAA